MSSIQPTITSLAVSSNNKKQAEKEQAVSDLKVTCIYINGVSDVELKILICNGSLVFLMPWAIVPPSYYMEKYKEFSKFIHSAE